MSIINYASREIQFKIVYYGPALCGKTTNLAYIHQRINPQNRGDLVSLATAADRTLFFDFLPLNAVVIKGFEYVLNNRKKRVSSFEVISSTGQNVFASLNAVSQILLHKFSRQSDIARTGASLPAAALASTTPPAAAPPQKVET